MGTLTLNRGSLWAIAALAALAGIALVPLIANAEFAADHGLWIVLELVIGWGFAGVGLFAWYRRPGNAIGALMVATSFAWFASVLVRTEPPLLFTLGFFLGNVFVATAIHLLLAFPSGRLESTVDRVLVGWSYITVIVGFLVPTLFLDFQEGMGCAGCPDNVFLVDSRPSFADTWLESLSICGIVLLPAVVLRLVQRWRDASEPLRRTITPVFLAGGTLMIGLAVLLIMSFTDLPERLKEILFYSTLVPFGLVPFLFLAGLFKGRMLRGQGLGALVSRIGAGVERGELRAELSAALGDPSVELAYWLPDSKQYVDAEGRPIELPHPRSGRAVTDVVHEGRKVAAIVHDPMLLEDPEHVREAGAAAAMALENARLEAELRAKVEEVRASRSRLVEVGMRQRRRLERDLHDGAQQRLVSLALTLSLAQEKLYAEPTDADRLLDRSREELEQALQELRELARGIHPAVLSDRGLGAAVRALADRAPLPVEIDDMPSERLPEPIELATYFVVSEALTNVAKYASAQHATVAVKKTNGRLTVEVSDDGVGGADVRRGTGLRGLADRLDAMEGRLDVASEQGSGTTVRASIPLG